MSMYRISFLSCLYQIQLYGVLLFCIYISFLLPRVRCHEGVNLINAMRLWGATPSMATLPAVNGFDCQPLKPAGRVLCRESQNRFCFGRGINSGGLLLKAFVVPATKKMRALAHIMFSLLQGFGGGKAPIVSHV